jgi:hypothetical protein
VSYKSVNYSTSIVDNSVIDKTLPSTTISQRLCQALVNRLYEAAGIGMFPHRGKAGVGVEVGAGVGVEAGAGPGVEVGAGVGVEVRAGAGVEGMDSTEAWSARKGTSGCWSIYNCFPN